MDNEFDKEKKRHNKRAAGRKADKKSEKSPHVQELTAKQRNPKAFAVHSAVAAGKRLRRAQDISEKRTHIPVIDRTALEPPPIVISIVGPPKVGKSTLLRCLIRNFTRKTLTDVQGPVTIVSGKKRRVTFIECNNDINSMIDVAKVTDLVLLLVDASFGFEMETFEFLNICQVHGFPRVMGVLTHLDMYKDNKKLRKIKKTLKHRFWTDVYPGAKLFYLSGMVHGDYQRMEVHNLGRFISVMKFRPLDWRQNHPYLLADRMEDLTSAEDVRRDNKCDRRVSVYGYVRGVPLRADTPVHLPGVGDFRLASVDFLPDPCPLPNRKTKSRRSLNELERSLYAPMSGVGGIVYDKDAVYIELRGSHSHGQAATTVGGASRTAGGSDDDEAPEDVRMMHSLKDSQRTIDQLMATAELQVFSDRKPMMSQEAERELKFESVAAEDGRTRRKMMFPDNGEAHQSEGDESEQEDEQESENGEEVNSEDEQESGSDSEDEEFCANDVKVDADAVELSDSSMKTAGSFLSASADSSALRVGRLEPPQNAKQLRRLIYGGGTADGRGVGNEDCGAGDDSADEQEVGGLFRISRRDRDGRQSGCDRLDSCRSAPNQQRVIDWSAPENRQLLASRFIAGELKTSEDAASLLKMDDDGEEDEAMDTDDDDGDFEDLETGVKHSTSASKAVTHDASDTGEADDVDKLPVKEEKERLSRKQMMDKKKRLKATFDAEYDDKESSGFYADLKRDLDQQTQLNRNEFEDLEDADRVMYEGYRAGMYLRLEIAGVPCELVTNFDASYPLIVGGLSAGEENIGYVQARMKRHRWYKKTLKTKDPLIVSLGWRRFQTVPLYSSQDHNGRHRMLKYTPDHLHCTAHFFGPITPQGSGILALQAVADSADGTVRACFRVAATGVVLDLDKSISVVKKLKLVGTPQKVLKKTAFIQGLFSTTVEAAKFEGALCRTVSGVRGHVKRALLSTPGLVRCTFEDRIKPSDLVFIRTWCPVTVPRLYAPVCSLLLPRDRKNTWTGMKTVGQLKRERGIRAQVSGDHLYTPVVRRERQPKPLHIPGQLQKQLPYADKLKLGVSRDPLRVTADGVPASRAAVAVNERVAVVLQPREQKVHKMLSTLRAVYEVQQKKQKAAAQDRVKKMMNKHQAELDKFEKRQKRVRKHLYKVLAQQGGGKKKT